MDDDDIREMKWELAQLRFENAAMARYFADARLDSDALETSFRQGKKAGRDEAIEEAITALSTMPSGATLGDFFDVLSRMCSPPVAPATPPPSS